MWLVTFTAVVALALSGLLVRQWLDQRATERELDELRGAVCGVTEVLGGGPTPAAGPAGDRARAAIPRMRALRDAACDDE